MNQLPLNKNELPLIREMLTKYKQGYISGLIPGSNITLSPSGCRNKIISSTGGGGGGGTPAGSDTQIQYNNAGSFGADAGFTRDSSGNTLISATYSGTDTYSDVISNNILGYGLTGAVKTWTGTGGNLAIQGIYEVAGFHVLANSLVISGKENGMVSKESGEVVLGNLSGGNNTKITIDDIAQTINFNNNYSFPFADGAAGQVLGTDGSGQLGWQSVSGGGGQIAFTKTKAEIDALIAGNNLVKNALYEITGVHPTLYDDGTTSGTTIYLRAISGNQLEVQGMGKFYNPKYNQSVDGFGIWDDKMYGTLSNVVGNFDYINKESVTADNSATGLILANGMIQWISGDWSAAVSITGSVSGATADVVDFVTPSYSIGDKVIWGGYSWTNVNGNIGASVDVLNLNAEWTKNVYDTTNYNIAYDLIEYDYANDMIIRRFEKESNVDVKCSKAQYDYFALAKGFVYHSISVQQFGNEFKISIFKGQLNIDVDNGYNESINFRGVFQYNLTFGSGAFQGNLTFGSNAYQQNLTFGSGAFQYNLTFGSNAYQQNLTLGSGAVQGNLTFGSDAYQRNLTFGSGTGQINLTLGSGAFQYNLTFGNGAVQENLTFGSGAVQGNLTFGSDAYQRNLTFGNGAVQENLTFAEKTQLNYNNQTINSNIEYVNFRTKSITVPDLSAATYIYDGNVKEVYQRPDGALKIRYYDNSDALQIVDIDD